MTKQDVIEFVEDNGVKFIRLGFCDIYGNLKNISINAKQLPRAFDYGIGFDASSIIGFMNVEESDLLLFPDADTLRMLPWRPSTGSVVFMYCDIRYTNGKPFLGDGRYILNQALKTCENLGYVPQIGTECEFYLFKNDDYNQPTKNPNDTAGYCDVAPLDACENVRREICLNLEEMGIQPEYSHHEQGPGQNEIVFEYANALKAADNMISFKSCVKAIAMQNGLYASFMPKPLENESGSGLHINISLKAGNKNLFTSDIKNLPEIEKCFISGIINRARELSAILNPTTNSYKRLGKDKAPQYITWSEGNRSQFIRIPIANEEYSRIEIRSADCSANPYLAFAMIIYAGLEGIYNKEILDASVDKNLYEENIEGLKTLPKDLGQAIDCMQQSDFLKKYMDEEMIAKYIEGLNNIWHDYLLCIERGESTSDFEDQTYFKFI